jgi:hypothetical protein
MQQIDGFQRANHHLEMRDAIIRVETDDIDAIDRDPLNLVGEFQHATAVAGPFANKGKTWIAQDLGHACQIFEGNVTAVLRRVHHRAFEHDIRVKQVPKQSGVVEFDDVAPSLKGIRCHRTPPAG